MMGGGGGGVDCYMEKEWGYKKMEALEAPQQMPTKHLEPVYPWLLSVTVASNASSCYEKAAFVCFRALRWLWKSAQRFAVPVVHVLL